MTMYRIWPLIPLYLLLPSLGAAQESEESFRQTALSVLQQQLQQANLGLSGAVLKRIAQETGLSEVETRQRLLVLLDSLETERQGNTAIWQEVLSVGGEAVPQDDGQIRSGDDKRESQGAAPGGGFLAGTYLEASVEEGEAAD